VSARRSNHSAHWPPAVRGFGRDFRVVTSTYYYNSLSSQL